MAPQYCQKGSPKNERGGEGQNRSASSPKESSQLKRGPIFENPSDLDFKTVGIDSSNLSSAMTNVKNHDVTGPWDKILLLSNHFICSDLYWLFNDQGSFVCKHTVKVCFSVLQFETVFFDFFLQIPNFLILLYRNNCI